MCGFQESDGTVFINPARHVWCKKDILIVLNLVYCKDYQFLQGLYMYNFVRGSRGAFKWSGLRGLITRVKKVFQHKLLIKMLFEFDPFFHASNHHIKMKSYQGLYRMYFFCLQIHVGLYSGLILVGGGAYDRKFMLLK